MSPLNAKYAMMLAMALIAPVTAATQKDKAKIRASLEKRYDERISALRRNDLKTFKAMLTDDFAYAVWDGEKRVRQPKETFLNGLPSISYVLSLGVKTSDHIDDLSVQGKTVIAKVTETSVNEKTKSLGIMKTEETWIKIGKSWRLKQFVFLSGKTYSKGKLVRTLPKARK